MESTPESTERLSSLLGKVRADELTELYERHGVDNVPDLVTEIRRDGSSTIATWVFRSGEGVHYDEIVMDVATKVGLKDYPAEVTDETELELLVVQHLVRKHFDSLSP
ncbi:MAG: hypothetical protein RDU20_18300, partial [Desulfomonilaceae bacterium]|nr:hypothetical protein [Desulfomonilaceae bacterium]